MLPLTKVTKSIKRGKPIKLDDEGNIPVIGPAAIRMMNIDGENIRTTSEGNLPKNPIRLKSGDVILNNIGTQLGAAVGIDDRFDRYLVSQHVLVIRPDTSLVLPEFLAAALNSGFVKTQLQRRATGVLIPSLTIGRFTEIEVPIPSIEVQSKVIENINRSREALELARTNFERAETEFERAIKHLISEEGEE
jgi:restriction endonuclease S subunit